jgi:hypothetical protein
MRFGDGGIPARQPSELINSNELNRISVWPGRTSEPMSDLRLRFVGGGMWGVLACDYVGLHGNPWSSSNPHRTMGTIGSMQIFDKTGKSVLFATNGKDNPRRTSDLFEFVIGE